jgi:hypothetical protein
MDPGLIGSAPFKEAAALLGAPEPCQHNEDDNEEMKGLNRAVRIKEG